ncbi:16S rRNA (uracil(1498)-N(3))-methyltransferase [Sediminibacterium roseum]|uniref:Ribosomal RNA small subunit methyltransferase E n=1 Tax=Sediminibacterium roseum TaxID=1978412 RepID=A0ABW9ZP25_9BACT|nr:RsmE family RNA methyltransferase [Sediminibacterium roseum]NCI48842.1 16S rRNA (uracil(1498)-N(3))-methyltransferase [Sediminibacterium roseum]
MALPFFYENTVSAASTHFTLSEETSKHCTQVLRMRTGAALQLTDGRGNLFKASIISEDKRKTVVLIEEQTSLPAPAKKTNIAIALLKNNSRFEWFLEKATEIGVTEIQPLLTDHTEHTRFRHDRMNGILIAAMLQSQQAWLPVLHEPIAFNVCVKNATHQQKLIAHCEDEQKNFIRDLPASNDVQVLIGPEGDFSHEEIRLALDAGFIPVSLGNTRLRAETAGVVAATLVVQR